MVERLGFEFESHNINYNHDGLYSTLRDDFGFDFVTRVKTDGSLQSGGKGGYEINSDIFVGFSAFKNKFMNMAQALRTLGDEPHSPAAIHLHVSNISKPQNFFLIANSLYHFFKRIVILNNSRINFTQSERVYEFDAYNEILSRFGQTSVNTPMEFMLFLERLPIENNRGRVIRRTAFSLEFRPIPTKLDEDYLEIWLEIYKKILTESQSMTSENCYKRFARILSLEKANEFLELEKNQLKILGNGENPLDPIKKKDFFKTLPEEQCMMSINHGYDFPIMDGSNKVYNWMFNRIYSDERILHKLHPFYRLRATHIAVLYNWCVEHIEGFDYPIYEIGDEEFVLRQGHY